MDLRDLEIFRAGTYGEDEYTVADLDEMVSNFRLVGFDVPVKLGRDERAGEPAYGWVSRIRRVGHRLLADLRDLPAKIHDAISARRFSGITAELFWNLKREGITFRRALKAITLLGTEAGLKPLRDTYRGLCFSAEAVKTYTLKQEQTTMTINPDAEVDRRVKALRLKEPSMSYALAMENVLRDDDELKAAFAGRGISPRKNTAGDEIDRMVRKLIAQNPMLSYTQACRAILGDPDNAELKIRYAQGQ